MHKTWYITPAACMPYAYSTLLNSEPIQSPPWPCPIVNQGPERNKDRATVTWRVSSWSRSGAQNSGSPTVPPLWEWACALTWKFPVGSKSHLLWSTAGLFGSLCTEIGGPWRQRLVWFISQDVCTLRLHTQEDLGSAGFLGETEDSETRGPGPQSYPGPKRDRMTRLEACPK